MSSKQVDTRNKVKKLCIYAMLVAVCMVLGYIESLFELSFIAPGIKIGLSNAVACVLVLRRDCKGAFAVNLSRIILSSVLFGTPVSFLFAACGGVVSLLVMAIMSRSKKLSSIGISATGGAVHNACQCLVAVFVVGTGVIYYLPVLLVAGVACGVITGTLSKLILNRMKGNNYV